MRRSLPIELEIPEYFFKEEVRSGYKVESSMKEVWAVELDLLDKFMTICDKHNLKWFIAGGSALGAIRHKGFIPWDDDIDIVMPREDYDRFCKFAKKELHYPYFFSNGHNEGGVYRCHSQLRNSKTTAVLEYHKNKAHKFNQGIFIDVFPLDAVPENKVERDLYFKKLERYYTQAAVAVDYSDNYRPNTGAGFYRYYGRLVKHLFCRLVKYPEIFRVERFLRKYNKAGSDIRAMISLFPMSEHRIYKKTIVDKYCNTAFEFLSVPVPEAYDQYLSNLYGDWKTPVQGTSIHGKVMFDTRKPYTAYAARKQESVLK